MTFTYTNTMPIPYLRGTLLHKEKYDIYIKQTLSAISGRVPTPGMMAALKKLSDDPANAVMVVTGLTKTKLGETFKDFPNITLVTSNGLVYSWGANMLTPDEQERYDEAKLSSSMSGTFSVSASSCTIPGTGIGIGTGAITGARPQGAVVTPTPVTSTNSLAAAATAASSMCAAPAADGLGPVAVTYEGTGLDVAQSRCE
jgi:hypothetical protein